MTDDKFEQLKQIAKDEFGVSIVKADNSETSQILLDEMRVLLQIAKDKPITEANNTFPKLQMGDFIEVYGNKEMRFFLNDEFGHYDGKVQPDEDYEFKEEDVTEVWRQVDSDTFKCIYKREKI